MTMSNTCNICPNHCNIKNNTICKQKPTLDNENIIYTSAVAVDPIEKKPLYHYMPGSKTLSIGTVGCNLQCLNCQNHSIAQPADERDVLTHKYSPSDIVDRQDTKGPRVFPGHTTNRRYIQNGLLRLPS